MGIDLSMTSTGVAKIYSNGGRYDGWQTDSIKSKGTRADTLHDRSRRIRRLKEQICSWINTSTELVLIESPSLGSRGAGTWDRAGLWWGVASWCEAHDVQLAECSPLSLKKWATNVGSAKTGKPEMMDAFERLNAERTATSDESDAYWLAHGGAFHWGLHGLPTFDHHDNKLLRSWKWPT